MTKSVWYLFHPNATETSLNKKIFNLAKDTISNTKFIDLSNSTPFDVKTEQKNLADADKIVFQYPIWWSNHPPQLSEFLNKVFTDDFAYGKGTALKNHEIVTVTTTGASPESYRALGGPRKYTPDEDKTYWSSVSEFVKANEPKHFNLFSSYSANDSIIKKYVSKVDSYINSDKK